MGVLLFLGSTFLAPAQSLSLNHLKSLPNLTPEVFMTHFKDFSFKLGEVLQQADLFLASRTGDCDDFATVAAEVFRAKGFKPRLVAVYMEKEVHVVCFLPEARAYLDYNYRNRPKPLESSDGSLEDIARKVSLHFKSAWRSVSEVEIKDGLICFLNTAFR